MHLDCLDSKNFSHAVFNFDEIPNVCVNFKKQSNLKFYLKQGNYFFKRCVCF